MSPRQIRRAERRYEESGRDPGNYPDRIYREERTRPLLAVHLLAIGDEEEDLSSEAPVAAWGLSFPGTAREEDRVEYLVNTTWMREHGLEDDVDDDD